MGGCPLHECLAEAIQGTACVDRILFGVSAKAQFASENGRIVARVARTRPVTSGPLGREPIRDCQVTDYTKGLVTTMSPGDYICGGCTSNGRSGIG